MNITHLLGIFFAVILLSGSVPLNSFAENEMMVLNTIQSPKKQLEHDTAISSHIQNNTGWDREIFHDYNLFVVTDKFGKFVLPYKFESDDYIPVLSDTKIKDVIINYYIENIPGDLIITLNSYYSGSYYFLIPSFVDNSIFTYDGILIEGEEQNYNVKLLDTHTQYSINNISANMLHFAISSIINDNEFFHVSMSYDYTFPPLKQIQNGVIAENILCKEHLELMLKPNNSPACVKSESIPKLISFGWVYVKD